MKHKPKNAFQKWLHSEYIAYQQTAGEHRTLQQFAEFCGIKNQTLNQWLNGDTKPNSDSLWLLWKSFGEITYEKAGVPVPEYVVLIELSNEYLLPETIKAIHARAQKRMNA
jgi:hypothetical protein